MIFKITVTAWTNALSLWFLMVVVIVCELHRNDIVAAVNVSVN